MSQILGASGQVLKSNIQRSTIAITGATSGTATVSSVTTTQARVRHLGCTTDDASANINVASSDATLTNATTVTVAVNTSPGAGTTTTSFELSEYATGILKSSVQRGTILITGAVSNTGTISSVTTTKTELDRLGDLPTAASQATSVVAYQVLTNATTITATRGTNTGNTTARYQVSEWTQ